MTTVDQYLSTIQIDGALTPEQAAQVLDLPQEGDTAPVADLADAPASAPAPVAAEETTTTTTDPDPETKPDPEADPEAEPAILAKDGKNLIPFEKLAEARESAKRAAAERDEAIRRAEELQAKLDAAGKEPATKPEEGITIADLRRERYNALLDGDLERAIQLEEKIEDAVQAQRQQVETAAAAFARVAQEAKVKYPALDLEHEQADKDAIDFVVLKRDALIVQGKPAHEALAKAVEQAAKLFRWSDGQATAPTPTPDPKAAAAAAAAAIAQAKAPVPASLSAIPGGKPGALSALEQMAGKASGPELLQVMENMTPEQIEAFLNRSL